MVNISIYHFLRRSRYLCVAFIFFSFFFFLVCLPIPILIWMVFGAECMRLWTNAQAKPLHGNHNAVDSQTHANFEKPLTIQKRKQLPRKSQHLLKYIRIQSSKDGMQWKPKWRVCECVPPTRTSFNLGKIDVCSAEIKLKLFSTPYLRLLCLSLYLFILRRFLLALTRFGRCGTAANSMLHQLLKRILQKVHTIQQLRQKAQKHFNDLCSRK